VSRFHWVLMGLATKLRWEKSLLSSGKAKRHFLLITLIERKSRVPLVRYRLTGEIQGVQGRSHSNVLRALGNDGDGVSSAFPKGKQNGEKKELI
jgi:hypothetical protein